MCDVIGDVGLVGEQLDRGEEAQLVVKVSLVYIICLFELNGMAVVGA